MPNGDSKVRLVLKANSPGDSNLVTAVRKLILNLLSVKCIDKTAGKYTAIIGRELSGSSRKQGISHTGGWVDTTKNCLKMVVQTGNNSTCREVCIYPPKGVSVDDVARCIDSVTPIEKIKETKVEIAMTEDPAEECLGTESLVPEPSNDYSDGRIDFVGINDSDTVTMIEIIIAELKIWTPARQIAIAAEEHFNHFDFSKFCTCLTR